MAFRRLIASVTAACFLCIGFQSVASATVIGTQEYLHSADRAQQITQVQAALSRQDVQSALVRLGVDPVAAGERVASLSDQELARVAGKLDSLPAGGDSLLAVIGIVFVVLLILELTGVTDIFKKI
jgi:hypothetical protein